MFRNALVPSTILVLALAGAIAIADTPVFNGSGASNTQTRDCGTRARVFDPFELAWFIPGTLPLDEQIIRCTTTATDGGQGRRGVRVRLTGQIVDGNGNVTQNLGTRLGRTNSAGQRVVTFPNPDLPAGLGGVLVEGRYLGNKKADSIVTECTAAGRVPCLPDDETLCLGQGGRFQVEAEWRDQGASGVGQVFDSRLNEGSFWFFNQNNAELVVRMLDGCRDNHHWWVFYAATTDVEYNLRVTDTDTGATREYVNPLGVASPAITDTRAFATCP